MPDHQAQELAVFVGVLLLTFCVMVVFTVASMRLITGDAGAIDISFSAITLVPAILARHG
jgi:hypothetical protein